MGRGDVGSRPRCPVGRRQPRLRTALVRWGGIPGATATTALVLLLAGCTQEAADRTPLQQVDWRNGLYAEPCVASDAAEYVDGRTAAADGGEGSTSSADVGYADFDGRAGDEAVLTHSCDVGGGSASLSVWTTSDDGPALVGAVESPEYGHVQDWSDDRGVLCVAFFAGDNVENHDTRTRAFAVGPDGVRLLTGESCDVEDA